jgi:hypothetical protein
MALKECFTIMERFYSNVILLNAVDNSVYAHARTNGCH